MSDDLEIKGLDDFKEQSEQIEQNESKELTQDEQLIEYAKKASQGDEHALGMLCAKIVKPVLYRVVSNIKNKSDAEDIAQNIMLVVCESIHKIRDLDRFGGWLNKVIINQINNYILRNGKYNEVEDIDEYKDFIEDNDETRLPAEMFENKEGYAIVADIIKKLSEQQQRMIMLKYYEGMSVTEITKATGLSKQSVSTHLSRAHKNIKDELEKVADTIGGNAANFLSFGALMSEFFKIDAEVFTATNAAWAAEILGECEPYIQAAIATIATAATGVATSTATTVVTTTAATTTAATTGAAITAATTTTGAVVTAGMSASTIATVACAIAVVAIGTGVAANHIISQDPQPQLIASEQIIYDLDILGEVYLIEETDNTEPYLRVDTATGTLMLTMTAKEMGWQIIYTETGEILFTGTNPTEIFASQQILIENGYEGTYTIKIRAQDQYGNERRLSRDFTLTP